MPHARVNGVDIYFERHGDQGEPLVLIHGYTGDVTDWRHQIAEFAPTHRVLVMDNRGHGQSSAPADRDAYTVEAMSHDAEAVIREAGFERYHLVGHSMGGAISQEIALRSPGRLMSLTLHDTSNGFSSGGNDIVRRFMQQRIEFAEKHGMAKLAEQPWPFPDPPHASKERKVETNARLARMAVDGFAGALRGLTSWAGSIGRAHAIAAPTLVIYGELDRGLSAASEWLAANIPGAKLAVVPEAGHAPQEERPDIFNAHVRSHVERHAGGGTK